MSSFWNIRNLDKEIVNTPNGILEEQAKEFDKLAKSILYAIISNTKILGEIEDYKLTTKFNIVAPQLDKYTYTVCVIYSNPEDDYPVNIKENGIDDTGLDIGVKCNNKEEFSKELERIISSEKVSNVIRNLYSKSKLFD